MGLKPGFRIYFPRGSMYTTIMDLGPQNHNGDGLLGPNSKIVVYMDPLGLAPKILRSNAFRLKDPGSPNLE